MHYMALIQYVDKQMNRVTFRKPVSNIEEAVNFIESVKKTLRKKHLHWTYSAHMPIDDYMNSEIDEEQGLLC